MFLDDPRCSLRSSAISISDAHQDSLGHGFDLLLHWHLQWHLHYIHKLTECPVVLLNAIFYVVLSRIDLRRRNSTVFVANQTCICANQIAFYISLLKESSKKSLQTPKRARRDVKMGKVLIDPLFAENDPEAGRIILEVSFQIPHHQPPPAPAHQSHPCQNYNSIKDKITNNIYVFARLGNISERIELPNRFLSSSRKKTINLVEHQRQKVKRRLTQTFWVP